MKSNILTSLLLFYSLLGIAQSINYQAAVKNSAGIIVSSQAIGVKARILQGSATGTKVYEETHTITSNEQGVIALNIGEGTTVDDFSLIDWSSQNHWLEIGIDITGGTSYTTIGTSKLISVPYALFSKKASAAVSAETAQTAVSANNIIGGIQVIHDTDNDTKIQVEKVSDEDVIRIDVAGAEVGSIKKNAANDMIINTGTSNVIIGQGAGGNNTGDSNIFIGKDVARLNTTGRRNVVMGNQAGFGLKEGSLNVYVGTIAGKDNATGTRNVAVGDSAGSGPDGNTGNVFLGTACGALSGGNDNVMIGDSAGANNAAGNKNVMVGVGAGLSSTGSDNVFIGYFVGASESGSNKLHIDNSNTASPLIYGEFDNNIVKVNGSFTTTGATNANGGIFFPGSFNPDTNYVGSTGNFISFAHPGVSEDFIGYKSNNFYFRDSPGGGDTAQPSVYAQSFPTYSSRRWKHNIYNIENALKTIQKLRGVTYTWNKTHGGKDDFGFIAEEVHEILPQAAKKGQDGEVDGVDYGRITPYLVEAIKQQQLKIEELEKKVEELTELKTMIAAIQKKLNSSKRIKSVVSENK